VKRKLPQWLAFVACMFTALNVFAADESSPADHALDNFRRGANFGNYLEVPPDQNWALSYDLDDIRNTKREGFDHIRLPVGWHHYAGPGPEYKLSPEIFSKVDFIVTNALNEGLAVLINIHHFDEFTTNPEAQTDKFLAIWDQVARHYQSASPKLAFELLNEPKDAATTERINPIYARAIAVIRETNPGRTIFAGPGRWDGLDEVPKLKLPKEDRNLIVTVHCYDPFLFTHQGATWTGSATETTGITYPGPPAKAVTPKGEHPDRKWFAAYNNLPADENPCGPKAFTARMEKVAQWGKEHRRPIYLGEFGAFTGADQGSRARYYRDMRQTAERLGFGWAIWDWKAGFKYWNGKEALPGMREALFGK
jgi:endoglucanase